LQIFCPRDARDGEEEAHSHHVLSLSARAHDARLPAGAS